MNEEVVLSKSANKKFLRILITEGSNKKININLPIALAEVGLRLIPKDNAKLMSKLNLTAQDINFAEILRKIKSGYEGELVNIEKTNKDKIIKVNISIK